MLRFFARAVVPSVFIIAARMSWAQPAMPELHWYRGNLHTHTNAPGGNEVDASPDFIARWYRDHGYQFLVLTDHEHLTDVGPLNKAHGRDGRFLVIRGQEITQGIVDAKHLAGFRAAHVNGIDINRPIEDQPEKGVTVTQTYEGNFAAVRAAGGIPQVNHPNLNWSIRLEDLLPLSSPYLFEVWNGYPFSNNLGGSDGQGDESPSAEQLWDELLSRGKVVWGTATDDAHSYHHFDNRQFPSPGRAWVVVHARELSAAAIVQALRHGEFYASTGVTLKDYQVRPSGIEITIAPPADHFAELQPSTRFATRFIGQNGQILAEVHGLAARYSFGGTEKYVRASIIDSDGRRAWTQPVFRDGRQVPDGAP